MAEIAHLLADRGFSPTSGKFHYFTLPLIEVRTMKFQFFQSTVVEASLLMLLLQVPILLNSLILQKKLKNK